MVTLICTLSWPDGKLVEASLSARAPENERPVKYNGDVSLLEDPPTDANVNSLSWFMREEAERTRAQYKEVLQGEFDEWAL